MKTCSSVKTRPRGRVKRGSRFLCRKGHRARTANACAGLFAFTRLDLVAVLAAVALVAGVAFPGLSGTRTDAERLGCVNNLRRIGQAYQLWGNDHGEALPCRTSYRDGGLQAYPSSLINNAWFHFAWLSNELVTPRILACPGDPSTKAARDFSTAADGGFLNPAFRGNALSYLVSLDALAGQTLHLATADRHLSVNSGPGGCSSGVTTALSILLRPPTTTWFTNQHEGVGHVLLCDGRVQQLSTPLLRQYLGTTLPGNGEVGSLHILLPRW